MRLLVGTDQIVEIPLLSDDRGNPVLAARVEARVLDRKGDPLASPVPLDHRGEGRYSGQLDVGDSLVPRHPYTLEVTAAYSQAERTWRQKLTAEYGDLA